jgi:hypothetical protein
MVAAKDEPDTNFRVFKGMKINYGKVEGKINLE